MSTDTLSLQLMTALIDRRYELGITQAQLAERLGIGTSGVGKFESDCIHRKRSPSLETIAKYAAALDTTIAFTLTTRVGAEMKETYV